MLVIIAESTHNANILRQKNPRRSDLLKITRPWDVETKVKKIGSGALPIDEFDAWWASRLKTEEG